MRELNESTAHLIFGLTSKQRLIFFLRNLQTLTVHFVDIFIYILEISLWQTENDGPWNNRHI